MKRYREKKGIHFKETTSNILDLKNKFAYRLNRLTGNHQFLFVVLIFQIFSTNENYEID